MSLFCFSMNTNIPRVKCHKFLKKEYRNANAFNDARAHVLDRYSFVLH